MLLKVMSILTLILFVGLMGTLAFWAWYPYKVVNTEPKPYKIIYPTNREVRQGEEIVYQFNYVKTTDIIPTVRRQFVDGLIFNVAGNENAVLGEAGEGLAQVQIHIPETLPPGDYKLRIIATYELNPIRTYVNRSETETFTVLPSLDK